MRKGCLLVKDISYDERIWEQLSRAARYAFVFSLPHQGTHGEVPRKARDLRAKALPFDKDETDVSMESHIQEWLHTKPSLCHEKNGFLYFADFIRCNSGLDFLRKRNYRAQHEKTKA